MPASSPNALTIAMLNDAGIPEAFAIMGQIVERSDWLAARAVAARPFGDAAALRAWLESEVLGLEHEDALQLLRAHPELAPPAPDAMTEASQREQARLNLTQPLPELAARLTELNRRYREKHGFPFVIALHAHEGMDAVLADFESRLAADTAVELPRSLREVLSVMQSRLTRLTETSASAPHTSTASPTAEPSSEKVPQ